MDLIKETKALITLEGKREMVNEENKISDDGIREIMNEVDLFIVTPSSN